MRLNLVFGVVIGLVSMSAYFANQRPAASDFKVRYKTTVGTAGGQGSSGESVTMIKGARERSETTSSGGYGFNTTSITQCDLKRTIQFSDTTKKYVITPMDAGESNASTSPSSPAPVASTPTTRGGVVDYITSTVDTGERKQMFGFTARHVKSSVTINASADACSPGKRRTEMDGWYIDLNVEFNCDVNKAAALQAVRPQAGGCKDKMNFKREGTGKVGYPLIETVTMYGEDGQLMFTQTKEVVELSRASLDAALFDIPAGYTQAASSSELYGTPSMASMMAGMNQGESGSAGTPTTAAATQSAASTAKRPGTLLVGVVQLNNKAGRPVPLDSLRTRLIGQIAGSGVDAIALNASSQMEAEAEAKIKQCDFILYTDIAALKMNKLGGMFGGITGVPGVAKTEAKLEFKLFAVGETSPRLQSNTSAKEEGDENSVGTAVDAEARMVSAEMKKKKG
jgi:hypothetical protein